jgi:hypothetical protein
MYARNWTSQGSLYFIVQMAEAEEKHGQLPFTIHQQQDYLCALSWEEKFLEVFSIASFLHHSSSKLVIRNRRGEEFGFWQSMVDQLVCWWAFNMQLSLNIKLVLVQQVVNQLWFQYPRCWKQAVVGSLLHPSTLQTSCAWPGSRNQISQVKNSRRGFNTRLHHVHQSVHQKEGQYDIAETQ